MESGFERLLNAILLPATNTVIVGAVYNFLASSRPAKTALTEKR